MPLQLPEELMFGEPNFAIPQGASNEFTDLIDKIVNGNENRREVYETFKFAYGNNNPSSDIGWAETDMYGAVEGSIDNGPSYVASFYNALERLRKKGFKVPGEEHINKILKENDVPLVIEDGELFLKQGDVDLSGDDTEDEPGRMAFKLGKGKSGGFGTVYEAMRRTHFGEYRYAMKVFEPTSFNPNPEKAELRFKREIEILATLQHRAIVTLLEAGNGPDGKPYILMPYIEGQDLRDSLSGAEPERVCRIFDELLNGLGFAHSKKVIHRDLSPDNVIVREADDQPIILDFGCAYLLDDARTSFTTKLIGKSPYVPPEVKDDPKHKDIRQDVFACGVMLYEVIAGRLPRIDDYQPIFPRFKQWEGVDEIIQSAVAPERKRLPNTQEFRKCLEEFLN